MKSAVVFEGLKSICEAKGLKVLEQGPELRDGTFIVKMEDTDHIFLISASRHLGKFEIKIAKQIKVNDRFNFEKEIATFVDELIIDIKSGYPSFCIEATNIKANIGEDGNFKIININLEILYGV